jgi:hypothetical protein
VLDQLPRQLSKWVGAALGAEGARANVAADLAEVHARYLEIEALADRLTRATSTTSPASTRAA